MNYIKFTEAGLRMRDNMKEKKKYFTIVKIVIFAVAFIALVYILLAMYNISKVQL